MFTPRVTTFPAGMTARVGGHLSALAGEPTAIHAAHHVQQWDLRRPETPHVLRAIGDSIAERNEALAGDFHRTRENIANGRYLDQHLDLAAEALAGHLDEVDSGWYRVREALARRAAHFAEAAQFVVGGAALVVPSGMLGAPIALHLMEQWELLHKNVLNACRPPISSSERVALRLQLGFLAVAPFEDSDRLAMVTVFQGDPWFAHILRRAGADTWEGVRGIISDALYAQLLLQDLKTSDPHRAKDIESRFEPLSPKEFAGILARQSGRETPVQEEGNSATL